MNCKQLRPEIERGSLCSFPMTVTITPRTPPHIYIYTKRSRENNIYIYIYIWPMYIQREAEKIIYIYIYIILSTSLCKYIGHVIGGIFLKIYSIHVYSLFWVDLFRNLFLTHKKYLFWDFQNGGKSSKMLQVKQNPSLKHFVIKLLWLRTAIYRRICYFYR